MNHMSYVRVTSERVTETLVAYILFKIWKIYPSVVDCGEVCVFLENKATRLGGEVDYANREVLHLSQLHEGRVHVPLEMYAVRKVGTQSTVVDFVIT